MINIALEKKNVNHNLHCFTEYFEAAVTGFSQATQKFLDDLDLLDTAE